MYYVLFPYWQYSSARDVFTNKIQEGQIARSDFTDAWEKISTY